MQQTMHIAQKGRPGCVTVERVDKRVMLVVDVRSVGDLNGMAWQDVDLLDSEFGLLNVCVHTDNKWLAVHEVM